AAVRADSLARARGGRGGRGGGAGARDNRAQAAGAAGILLVALDSSSAALVNAAFNSRMTMQPAAPVNASAPSAAAISRSVAATLFGKPVDQLKLGEAGQP